MSPVDRFLERRRELQEEGRRERSRHHVNYQFSEFLGIVVLVLMILYAMSAQASDCNAIRDLDKRIACQAEQRWDPNSCTSIRDWDAREVCRQRAGNRRDPWGRTMSDIRREFGGR